MKRPSQLTRLIWDFYRENQGELRQVLPLAQCRVFRRWGVLHIQCLNREMAEAIAKAYNLVREPVIQLRLAHTIKIQTDRNSVAVVDVPSGQLIMS